MAKAINNTLRRGDINPLSTFNGSHSNDKNLAMMRTYKLHRLKLYSPYQALFPPVRITLKYLIYQLLVFLRKPGVKYSVLRAVTGVNVVYEKIVLL